MIPILGLKHLTRNFQPMYTKFQNLSETFDYCSASFVTLLRIFRHSLHSSMSFLTHPDWAKRLLHALSPSTYTAIISTYLFVLRLSVYNPSLWLTHTRLYGNPPENPDEIETPILGVHDSLQFSFRTLKGVIIFVTGMVITTPQYYINNH